MHVCLCVLSMSLLEKTICIMYMCFLNQLVELLEERFTIYKYVVISNVLEFVIDLFLLNFLYLSILFCLFFFIQQQMWQKFNDMWQFHAAYFNKIIFENEFLSVL